MTPSVSLDPISAASQASVQTLLLGDGGPVAPAITTQPTDQTCNAGQSVTFTAGASGDPAPTAQWQISTDQGKTFTDIAGANSDSYTFTALATQCSDQLRAVYTNSAGTATTNAANLWVYSAPVITAEPPSVVWVNGENPQTPAIPITVTCASRFSSTWVRGFGYPSYAYFGNTPWLPGTYTFDIPIPQTALQNGMSFEGLFNNPAGGVSSSISTLQFYVAPGSYRPGSLWAPGASYTFPNGYTLSAAVGDTLTVYATAKGFSGAPVWPTPSIQWQISTDGGNTFTNFTDGQQGYDSQSNTWSDTFTATAADNGALLKAEFTNAFGSGSTTWVFLSVQQSTVSSVSASWGTAGTTALQVASDGLRLLPAGRNTDIPWMGINSIAVNLSNPATILPSDVSVKGVNVADYGPVTVSGSGASYVITLAQPINAADRVTLTINNAALNFTGRLDVLPGDVNDDGVVNAQDLVLIRNQIVGSGNSTIATFGDLNGDGVVDMTDFNLVRQHIGSTLP
jgi:hypothetical protein